MFASFKLNSSIGRSYNTDPDDVLKTKKALSGLGYYDEPDYGITPYPDTSLIRGIESFQRDHGLSPDGVMKPDGETMWMLGSVVGDVSEAARNLQSMGRNGDIILAHISPQEARLLKNRGGAGTVHPVTGLLEFSDVSKKEGEYIWHTAGDDKVRESHAARDGETFSWDSPPEGGHPGEAENCRCTAEDVPEEGAKCDELKVLMEEAWDRHDQMQNIILDAKDKLHTLKQELVSVRAMRPEEFISKEEYDDTESDYWLGRRGAKWLRRRSGGTYDYHQRRAIGLAIKREQIRELEKQITETETQIKELEREQQQKWRTATEYSRRYKTCTEKNGKPRN